MQNLFMTSITSIVLFVGAAAFAAGTEGCPDLSGSYQCDDSVTTISLTTQNGSPVYLFNGTPAAADDQAHPIGDNKDFQGTATYSCQQGTLLISTSMGPITTTASLSLDDQRNLVVTPGIQIGPQPIQQNGASQTCTRK